MVLAVGLPKCPLHEMLCSFTPDSAISCVGRSTCTRVRCVCTRVRHVYSWEVCVHERVPPGEQTLTGWGFKDTG